MVRSRHEKRGHFYCSGLHYPYTNTCVLLTRALLSKLSVCHPFPATEALTSCHWDIIEYCVYVYGGIVQPFQM